MNKYKTLASNALLISIGTFGSKLLVFLMVRFYTGYLTPADYGTADLLTQTANLLIPLFSLGITDGVFRFAIDRKGARASVFTSGFYTVTVGCIFLLAARPLLEFVPAINGYAWLIAAFVAASCYHALCAQFIRAQGNTTLFAVQGLINTALVIGLNILFLAVFRLGITGYVLSVAVANLITTILLVFKQRLWQQLVLCPRPGLLRKMFHYSIPLIPTSIFWWITSVSDRYMVSAFLGSEATGIYSVAYKIPTILTILSTVFMDAWQLSAVTESAGDRREHVHFYSKVWSAFQVAMFLCGACIIAFSQVEIKLLAAESYYSAWTYIPLLAMAMVFASFASFTGSVYVVTRKSNLSLWTAMLGAVINVVLNLLLIPSKLGVQGAAVATFASYFVVFIVRAVSSRKLIPFRLYPLELTICSVILTVQTIFIVFQLPVWQFVQAIGIVLILLLGYRPLLTGVTKIGIPVPGTGRNRFHTDKGDSHDSDSI
ncbi:MAG: polysaccharide biosynthesis C-terminal domain-containing protein [Oscillospiraceae bacterium]|nr:polysaccharide biosynthesis C-terminal domain-containing protein [Oscillospiraceae bacterium]